MIRHPKTTQELRYNERDAALVRPKRHTLVTLYDDNWTRPVRSWKKYRKTRWK